MKLELRPKAVQQQTLNPKMILSVNMLPLTNIELDQHLEKQLQENPALEMEEDSYHIEELTTPDDLLGEKLRLFKPFQDIPSGNGKGSRDKEDNFLDAVAAQDTNLKNHLLKQLQTMELAQPVRETAESIIGNLDTKGYLLFSREEILESLPERLKLHFEPALQAVQKMDPAGVGAQDLRECLLLQVRRSGKSSGLAERILTDYFDMLLSNSIPQLAAMLGSPLEEVKAALEAIQKLSTRPGAGFYDKSPQALPVDLTLEKGAKGYKVEVLKEGLPRVQISEGFRKLLSRQDLSEETLNYIREKIESARWLIQALEGRHRTLKSIAEAILDFQSGFLEGGPSFLRPLKMETVAEAVGVHLSTVSRAIKGKYIQTPWGVFPLRAFFAGSVPGNNGAVSTNGLKERISDIVQRENKRTPLSDSQLAGKLRAQGFEVSRRTISKYRDTMNIPSARLRKQF